MKTLNLFFWKMKGVFLMLFAGLMLFSCDTRSQSAAAGANAFQDIDVPEFVELMEQEDVLVLDVRTPGETAQGIIEGALEINVNGPDFQRRIQELDREKTYLVYCRSGRRSQVACKRMHEEGFNKLYNLKGGYLDWKAQKSKD